jgi:hypothetical protein
MPPPRRHATLLAFAQIEETTALDDVLDLGPNPTLVLRGAK